MCRIDYFLFVYFWFYVWFDYLWWFCDCDFASVLWLMVINVLVGCLWLPLVFCLFVDLCFDCFVFVDLWFYGARLLFCCFGFVGVVKLRVYCFVLARLLQRGYLGLVFVGLFVYASIWRFVLGYCWYLFLCIAVTFGSIFDVVLAFVFCWLVSLAVLVRYSQVVSCCLYWLYNSVALFCHL